MRKTLTLIRLRFVRLWWVMVLISAVGTAVGFAWWHFDFLQMSDDERNAYDDGLKRFNAKWWFPWGQKPFVEEMVLVEIDDKTFAEVKAFEAWNLVYGSWPYERIIWRDVIGYLDQVGARLVVMDVTLSEHQGNLASDEALGLKLAEVSVPVVMGFGEVPLVEPLPRNEHPVVRRHQRTLPQPATDAGADDEFPTEPSADERARAAAEARVKLRERAAANYPLPVHYEGGLAATPFDTEATFGLSDGGLATGSDLQRDAGLVTVELPRSPVPAIADVIDTVTGFGTVDTEADEDGKMRSTHFIYTDGANDYGTLATVAAVQLYGADAVTYAPGRLGFGEHQVRINPDGSALINYSGKLNDRFRTLSLSDVLRYRTAPEGSPLAREGEARLKGKVVFIGATAQGTGDQKPTPFSSFEPGVVKQMATLDNIMHDRFIRDSPMWGSLLLAFLVALFSVALVMVAQSFITDIGAPVFLTFSFFVLTGSFITFTNIHMLSAMPGMAGTLAAVCATAFNRFFANKDREFMREAFSQYMESEVLEHLVESNQLPQLDGEDMEVTAFFSDIRNFSSFSEALHAEPKKLMKLLNRYLSAVTPVLKRHGACIDKYIGDAVVALFGAPVRHRDHALRACQAALEVQVAIAGLRKQFSAEGLPDVYTRIGLNSDHMLVGNVGSDDGPIDFTAIGDGMNLAARLEGTNKAFDTLILMGPNTFKATEGQVVARELDLIRVAGKQQVVAVYELVGLPGQVPAQRHQVLELYQRGLALYRQRDFQQALAVLGQAHQVDPTDGPTKVLAAKCSRFMQHPPPSDWDGVTQVEK